MSMIWEMLFVAIFFSVECKDNSRPKQHQTMQSFAESHLQTEQIQWTTNQTNRYTSTYRSVSILHRHQAINVRLILYIRMCMCIACQSVEPNCRICVYICRFLVCKYETFRNSLICVLKD